MQHLYLIINNNQPRVLQIEFRLRVKYYKRWKVNLDYFRQENRDGRRAQQPATHEPRDAVHHRPGGLRQPETQAAPPGPREPRSPSGSQQGSKPGDPGVPVAVPE